MSKFQEKLARAKPAPKESKITFEPADERTLIRRDFEAATDWRKFLMDVRQKPEAGGYFYAMLVADLCGRKTSVLDSKGEEVSKSIVAATGTIDGNRASMLQKYRTRCATFADGEASSLYGQIKVLSADGRDPLVNVSKAFSGAMTSKDISLIESTAKAILETGDGTLINAAEVPARLSARDSKDLWFEGERYDTPDKRGALDAALRLGSCVDNSYCSLDDDIMIACISRNVCPSSRQEYLRLEYFPGSEHFGTYQTVLDLSNRIRSKILEGNTSAFLSRK